MGLLGRSLQFCRKLSNTFIRRPYNTVNMNMDPKDHIIAYWWRGDVENNWGDALNPILIRKFSLRHPILASEIINITREDVYSVVGSIIGGFSSDNLIIWGSGFIKPGLLLKKPPKLICAVRGPLTRKSIIEQGYECPEIYGDPGLLYPLLFTPKVKKKYKLGIVPHFIDKENDSLKKLRSQKDVTIIDIQGDINDIVSKICKCESIASSSLHGLIIADAYQIPSVRLKLSNNIIGKNFKFDDHNLSVGRRVISPLKMNDATEIGEIMEAMPEYHLEFDGTKLLEACPFLHRTMRKKLLAKITRFQNLTL